MLPKINLAVDFSSFNFNSFIVYFRISWIVYAQCSSHFRVLLAFVCGFHRYFIFSLWLYRNLFRAFCKWFILLCDSPSLSAFESRLRKRQRERERDIVLAEWEERGKRSDCAFVWVENSIHHFKNQMHFGKSY